MRLVKPRDPGAAGAPAAATERPTWRTVAVPHEHGGWGLTLEPVLLGLLVAWSPAGLAVGVAAIVVFLARTPLTFVLVDRHRDRWLGRDRLAARILAVELVLVAALALVAVALAGWSWLVPVALAAPFVAVELWFDMRSRGRRLVPELCGSAGIAAVAAAIVLAGDARAALAVGAWLVLAARSVMAIPFVRAQIVRLRRGSGPTRGSDVAQLAGLAVGVVAVVADDRFAAGAIGLAVIALLHAVWLRRPPVPAKVLGLRQMALGLALVAVTSTGVGIG